MQQPCPQFIDAHHHLWDLNHCHYPWLMERGKRRFFGDPSPIQRDYLVHEFLTESDEFRPAKSVHIQVGVAAADNVKETQWLQQLGAFPHAVVAAADLSSATLAKELDAQQQYSKLRGIRQIVGRHAVEDKLHGSHALLQNPAWQAGLALLAQRQLSFDLQLIPPQIDEVFAILQTVPELPVALCHCGSPWDQSEAGLQQWRQGLRRLAQLPRLVCKVSGLGMFNPTWQGDELCPMISAVIDIFGPNRVMFGSNFPVDKLYCNYDKLWRAYYASLAAYSPAERQQMLYHTAAEFYRLGD